MTEHFIYERTYDSNFKAHFVDVNGNAALSKIPGLQPDLE